MKPLEDLTILAIEQYGSGPFGSLHLADLGADVIKIEDPTTGGDVGRSVPPFQEGSDSLFFQTFNRNKRSIYLDMRNESGRAVFEDLVRTADAVYSNLRGDVPEMLGITYEHLSRVNPAIVCVSLSGFGIESSRSRQPGYDYIMQGMAGWMSLTGEPSAPPAKSGLSLVDFSGGLVAAMALLAAVHAARRDGHGGDCDLSLYDVATSLLTYDATWHLNGDWMPDRFSRSAHPSLVPFQLFQARDEKWFVVACAKEKFWRLLAGALGKSEMAGDPRFVDFRARHENRDELIRILDEIFVTAPASHWIETLESAGVPVGPVHTVEEALQDRQIEDRGLIVRTPHEKYGSIRSLRSPVRVGEWSPEEFRGAPSPNEHGAEILAALGYSVDEVEALSAAGAFG